MIIYHYIYKQFFFRFLKFGAMARFLLTFVVVAIISTSTHVDGNALDGDDKIEDIELRSGNKCST